MMTKTKKKQLLSSTVLLSALVLVTVIVIPSSRITDGIILSTATAQQTTTLKKVLIVTTSHNVLGNSGYPTGVWLSEMTHPFSAMANAGFNITIASVKGGNVPIDPYSIPSNSQGTNRDDPITEKFLHTPTYVAMINHTVPLSTINPKDYAAVIFPGGNGATYDFPWDKNVNKIAATIYEQGGVVAAVCHDPAALLNATLSNGQYLIKGMKVTGFSNEEEAGLENELPNVELSMKRYMSMNPLSL